MPSPVAPDCPDSPQPSLDLGTPDPGVILQLSTLAGFRHHQAPICGRPCASAPRWIWSARPTTPPIADAVAVYWRGRKLGYLPRGENLMAAALLNRRRALSARIRGLAPKAQRNQRVSLEVRMHSGT